MYSNNQYKIRATEKKVFFNSVSNGLIDVVKKMVSEKPELLKVTNLKTGNLGIFYAIKNRHLDVSIFLYENGQRFTENKILRLISTSKYPEKDYIFLTNLYKDTNFNYDGKIDGICFEDYVFNRLKLNCYSNNIVTSLEPLFNERGITPNWSEILTEYRIYKNIGNNPNSKTIQFIRDLTIKYLLDEELQ